MTCNSCSGTSFKQFAIRQDGMEVRQCTRCGLGVVANLPESTDHFYDDDYYLEGGSSGYQDYSFMAEHGLGWAAALVQLLTKQGKILDIGCADGYLLDKFTEKFERYGIEVNAKAAKQAEGKGVQLLGNDLLAPTLIDNYRNAFDVVTSIAVFEHLLDFRGGFATAIALLKQDGFLLFEVPVMSASGSNAAWLQSSFEHIYYPTEGSIRHIVENELGFQLVGAEIPIKDYASTYIGVVTKNLSQAARVKAIVERVTHPDFESASIEELRATTQLHLIHAGQASIASVHSLSRLDPREFKLPMVVRVAQLWSFDLRRSQSATERLSLAEAAAGESERLRVEAHQNEVRAMKAATYEISRTAELDATVAKLRGLLLIEEARTRDTERQTEQAVKRLQEIEQSTAWRATGMIRRWGMRNPAAARRARQVAKVMWWTLRGTIFVHAREFRKRRAEANSVVLSVAEADAANEVATRVRLLPVACVLDGTDGEPASAEWPAGRPFVSIIIPCFNYGHLVAEAIQSAEAQTFSDIEIIVVEGGSTSGESRQLLMEATANASARLRVLVQDKPHRAGENRNFGISHARGKYICCLDADDRIAPTYVEKAVFMLEHSGYDVVSPALQFFGSRSELWSPHERPTLDMFLEENNALTCAMYSRVWWLKAGGYRDSDRTTGHLHEDWLFWTRLAALGARFICIREALFYYRSHVGTLSNSHDVLNYQVQKRLITRFNEDVLTDANVREVRMKSSSPPARPPTSFVIRQHAYTSQSNRPTLLMALPFLVLGGAERLLSAVVARLTKNGWKVIIVTTVAAGPEHGDTTSWFEPSTTEIFHLPRFLHQEYWRDFIDHIFASRNVQLLWIIGSAFVYDHLPALKLRHAKLGVADLLFNPVGHTENNRRYADCIDLIFVENNEVKQWLLDAGEKPERINLVESGVDLEKNVPQAHNSSLVEMTGIPIGPVVIGFFGRWSEEKDPLGFIKIAEGISAELDVVFLMTGAGQLEEQVKKAIERAAFPPGRFVLKSNVPDLQPYLQICDVLCLPSRLDGRPNVIMEALASCTAVVASKVGALPEMIEEGRTGYLCTPGAYGEFSAKIEELIKDAIKLNAFKRNARRFAEAHMDINCMLQKYEDGLQSLTSK